MKKERTIIILIFVLIGLLGVGIFCFAYRPIFSGPISAKHADWEAFGDFFWGLGTMLFTGLSVIVLFIVNSSLNKYNENLQNKQQEFDQKLEHDRQEFERKMIEWRGEILKDIMSQKRIDYWQEEYHQIVIRLTQGKVKSDEEWLNLLRRVTVLYRSMQMELFQTNDGDSQNISQRMDRINAMIIKVLNDTYQAKGLKTNTVFQDNNAGLNYLIVNLFFDIFKLKQGLREEDMKRIFNSENVETQQ